ncbi:hypothetical protein M569_16310 [Genlisea aurea]|uniref:Plastid lipid-associated protein/fibrillin conserved domain-containing protein n=1 Tax=Genlisea aurea TaxID=192259 RepID=S8BVV6_9LAMI|nr:hypothetical protein M569_16310 [Genlisea aurea]
MACYRSLPAQFLSSEALSSSVSSSSSSSRPLLILQSHRTTPDWRKRCVRKCKAMVQQAVQGPSAAYAREMERLSAKESLLLTFKDSGGFEGLVGGKTTDLQRIDVNERIVSLERLNPSPRPTTSAYLEGKWNFNWFGSGSPGLSAARFLFQRVPPEVGNLLKLDLAIKDGYAYITATAKLLNSIESSIKVSTKLTVEGPARMKEEYIEGIIEVPKFDEESVPSELRGAFNALLVQPITNAVSASGGLKLPLGGTFQRLIIITYLDDEILIVRDAGGVAEVLTRLDPGPSPVVEPVLEYES